MYFWSFFVILHDVSFRYALVFLCITTCAAIIPKSVQSLRLLYTNRPTAASWNMCDLTACVVEIIYIFA